jgi:NAD(P)-dependent dehydrogenase (short-subunit alcohol dehydrogenase family)
MMDISGKVALVTGAGSGIGRASAQRLAKEGASVVVVDLNEDGGRETVAQIESAGPSTGSGQARVAFFSADVTDEANVMAMITFAEETFGGLDILHNNAGIITREPRYPEGDSAAWSRMLDINLRGVILGTQYGIQAMRTRGGGAIVNTASMAGIGVGFPPNPVYAAAKGGVVLFTASMAPLATEANIRVNCVCPGVVDTPMLRVASAAISNEERAASASRLSSLPILAPEDIADAVVSLIKDDSLAGRALMVRNGVPPELWRVAPRQVPGT